MEMPQPSGRNHFRPEVREDASPCRLRVSDVFFCLKSPRKKGLDHAIWVVTTLHDSFQVFNANQLASRLDYAVRDDAVANRLLLHEDPRM